MSAPYFQDESVTLYHGDCREVMATLADTSVDAVITDPPYSAATHKGARTRTIGAQSKELVDFDEWTPEVMRSTFDELGRIARRWVVATMDWRHVAQLAETPPAHLRFIRFAVWVKPNSTPQLTGDRPAQGWEAIACLHREDVKLAWNGGGKRGVWIENTVNAIDHPTAKPLPLVADWVRLFSHPGDTILDPFAGSGTTLVAAKYEGRQAIGVEIDERYCEVAAKRLSQGVLNFDTKEAI